MFKFEIMMFIDGVIFPALVIGCGMIWLYFFPEYCVLLTFITFIILLWIFPDYPSKVKKIKSRFKKNKRSLYV